MRIRAVVVAIALLTILPASAQTGDLTSERELQLFASAATRQDANPNSVATPTTTSSRIAVEPLATVAGDTVTGTGGVLWLGTPPSGTSFPSPGVGLRGDTSPISFATNGAERMRIFTDGRVDIGPAFSGNSSAGLHVFPTGSVSIGWPNDQGSRFYVYNGTPGGRAVYGLADTTFYSNGSNTVWGVQFEARNGVKAGVTNSQGVVGAQISSWNMGDSNTVPGGVVTYAHGGYFLAGNYYDRNATVVNAYAVRGQVERGQGTVTNGYALYAQAGTGAGTMLNGYGLYVENVGATNDWGIYQTGTDDSNYFAGAVGIGTSTPLAGKMLHVVGDARFDGTVTGTNIQAHYQDLAEWVPSAEDLAPGTVVVLDPTAGNTVMASSKPYDTSVAGVVSAKPGIILGEASSSKEQIATTGRVRVRVDARSGAVRIGDILVTSSIPGTAMKSTPVEVAGIAMHRPGTIIGKALETLDGGVGEILVLLSLQ